MIPEWMPPFTNLFDYVSAQKSPSNEESKRIKYIWFGSHEAFKQNLTSLRKYISNATQEEIEEAIYGALYQGWKMRELWWEWTERN